MIDFIHERLKKWGPEKRRILFGVNGWPSRTILGRLIAEGDVGASFSAYTQETPEVFSPDSLEVNNAFKQLPEKSQNLVFIHYVITAPAKQKCAIIGVDRNTYYYRLDSSHGELAHILYRSLKQNSANVSNDLTVD